MAVSQSDLVIILVVCIPGCFFLLLLGGTCCCWMYRRSRRAKIKREEKRYMLYVRSQFGMMGPESRSKVAISHISVPMGATHNLAQWSWLPSDLAKEQSAAIRIFAQPHEFTGSAHVETKQSGFNQEGLKMSPSFETSQKTQSKCEISPVPNGQTQPLAQEYKDKDFLIQTSPKQNHHPRERIFAEMNVHHDASPASPLPPIVLPISHINRKKSDAITSTKPPLSPPADAVPPAPPLLSALPIYNKPNNREFSASKVSNQKKSDQISQSVKEMDLIIHCNAEDVVGSHEPTNKTLKTAVSKPYQKKSNAAPTSKKTQKQEREPTSANVAKQSKSQKIAAAQTSLWQGHKNGLKQKQIPSNNADMVFKRADDDTQSSIPDMMLDLTMFDPIGPVHETDGKTLESKHTQDGSQDLYLEAEARINALFDDIFSNEKYTGGMCFSTTGSDAGSENPVRKTRYEKNWNELTAQNNTTKGM